MTRAAALAALVRAARLRAYCSRYDGLPCRCCHCREGETTRGWIRRLMGRY